MEPAPDNPPGWDFLGFNDPAFWQASHIAFSIDMVSSLPALREGLESERIFIACTEAWLLHYRLLAEFLTPGPQNLKHDVTGVTFGWTGPDESDRAYLEERKVLASKYLVHLSAERFPDTLAGFDYHPVTRDDMLMANTRLFRIFDSFLTHLEGQASSMYEFLRGELDAARAQQ